MKERTTIVVLTEEQKKLAYTPEQIGEELYVKLKDDPNFALMSLFCKNIGVFLANYAKPYLSGEEKFTPVSMDFGNKMWNWDYIEHIFVCIKDGYRNENHRMLYAEVPFEDGTDCKMSGLIKSGTGEEIFHYLHSSEFGPKLMMVLDELNTALGNHVE